MNCPLPAPVQQSAGTIPDGMSDESYSTPPSAAFARPAPCPPRIPLILHAVLARLLTYC